MEFGHVPPSIHGRRGTPLVQSLSQQITKEVVIAIPAPLVIEPDDE
jgi:hypothetical protein